MLKTGPERSTPPGASRTIACRARIGCSSVAFPVGDATAGEVIGADFHQDFVARQQFDAKLGQLPSRATQTLMSSRLLKGDKVKPISLLFFNHTRRFDHTEMKPDIGRFLF